MNIEVVMDFKALHILEDLVPKSVRPCRMIDPDVGLGAWQDSLIPSLPPHSMWMICYHRIHECFALLEMFEITTVPID